MNTNPPPVGVPPQPGRPLRMWRSFGQPCYCAREAGAHVAGARAVRSLACLDYGYAIVPSQSDKDENGRLLDDPFDPRCTEWLVEIPTEVSWANLPGADQVEIGQFSALAQFDFYMQVQRHYTTHNTSATVEFREHEIEPLADAIHRAMENGEGYISAALLARFDANATFPRLPFEPIDAATYQRLQAEVSARRRNGDFFDALRQHDGGVLQEAGPAG